MAKAAHASAVVKLSDIPNVGTSIAQDLESLGIHDPQQLIGADPFALYARINRETGVVHDPCVCDTFIAAVRFMEGGPKLPWWHHTDERKRHFARR